VEGPKNKERDSISLNVLGEGMSSSPENEKNLI
jgi:hypothetical protein